MKRRLIGSIPAATAALVLAGLASATVTPVAATGPAATGAERAGAGAAAPSDDPFALPDLQVDRFDPPVARPGRKLRAAGVLSAGSEDLTAATVHVEVATEPVSTRGRLGGYADGTQVPTATVEAHASEPVDVPAGQSHEWRLSVPLDDLGLDRAGVYPVVVSARSATVAGTPEPLASVRTFLAWYPEDTVARATRITWVVPLAGEPVRDAESTFLDDRTAADLAAGGRLRSVLEGLQDSAVDWAVDPELLEAVATMADGYRVRDEDGGSTAGGSAAADDARAFLATARDTFDSADSALSYAHPDADAMERAGLATYLVRSVTGAADVAEKLLRTRLRTDLAVPAGGHIGPDALSTLRAAGIRTVVLADTAVPLAETLPYTPSGLAEVSTDDGVVTAVLADSVLSSVVADPAAAGGADLLRQRFLAETLLVTQERPSDSRSLVVSPPYDWHVSPELAAELVEMSDRAPWLEANPLADLRREPTPEVLRLGLTGPPEETGGQIATRQANGAREVSELLSTFGAVLGDAAQTTERFRAAILRTGSASWRADRSTGEALLGAVRDNLVSDVEKVSILSRGTVTLSGTEGRIPVTVANDLDQSVVVEVRLTPRTPGRLTVEQPGEVRIGPRRKESLEIPARVNGAGTVPVDVQLFTTTDVAYGDEVTISVRSTAYSRLGLGVVGAALAALVVLVAARLFRRLRRARGDVA